MGQRHSSQVAGTPGACKMRSALAATPSRQRSGPSKAITYLRVSTRIQGASGFGIAAQRAIVADFAQREQIQILAEYVEVESAWRQPIERRPQLLEALARAGASGALLIIARLDRLARNASIVHALVANGTRFVCADAPWADQTTIGMLAVLAEREARLISDRMCDVRAEAKASGRPWRHVSNLRPGSQAEASRISANVRRARTRQRYAYVEPIAFALRSEGMSLRRVADELNRQGFETQRGTLWNDVSVQALLRRMDKLVCRSPGAIQD